MTDPRRFLFRMSLFLAVVLAIVGALSHGLIHAFMANPPLSSLILAVLLTGIVLNVRQVILLRPDIAWVEEYRRGISPLSTAAVPRMLAPIAAALDETQGRPSLSAPAMRALLDGIAARLDESRDISRYFIGLMIFLGLLGTFWGLSQTVGSIGQVISSLTVTTDTVGSAFERLKEGLGVPLAGMGTAFSSSLLGLGGSLVLGFLDLQSGQAQNAFFNDLEEWLSTQMRVSRGSRISLEGGEPIPAYIQALLEQTADSLDNLSRIIARGEESRASTSASVRSLSDKLATLSDTMKTSQALMLKLAEHQLEMKPLFTRLAEQESSGGMDEASRKHIRSLDTNLIRLLDEMARGREDIISEVRSEVRLLARTIAATAEEL